MSAAERAAGEVAAARQLLWGCSAEALGEAAGHLEAASAAIEELIGEGPTPADRGRLERLRGEVRAMGALLEAGARFCSGVGSELGVEPRGFGSARPSGRLALQG